MSEKKLKVNDLAAELGQDPKDVLAMCKELGFAAKSATALLKPDEISRIKTRVSEKNEAARDSNVKVRRKRQPAEGQAAEEAASAVSESPEASSPKKLKSEEVSASPTTEAGPEENFKGENFKDGQHKASHNEGREGGGKRKAAPPVAAPLVTAKIISKPEVADDSEAAEGIKPTEAPVAASARAETTSQVTGESVPERPESHAAQVRAGAPILSAEPERDASGQAVSSAPAAVPSRASAIESDQFGAVDSEDGEDGDRQHDRKRKPQREEVSATPQVRVISRPAPGTTPKTEQPARYGSGNRPGGGTGGQPYRPASGYAGQGGRPPRPAGGGEYGQRPGGSGGPGGQRPAGGGEYGQRPAGPGGQRPAGGGEYGQRPAGPGGQRPGGGEYGQRPAGPGGQRPGGGFTGPSGPRPAGPGGQRPGGGFAGPGGPRPAGPGGGLTGPPGTESEQSKKKRQKGKRTVDFSEDFSKKKRDLDADDGSFGRSRRSKSKRREQKPVATQPTKAVKRKIRVEEFIRVGDLAHQIGLKSSEIIKVLFGLGVMATINQALDIETATVVAAEFGYEVEKSGFSEDAALVDEIPESEENLRPRPPVMTIRGHVDHGKTSLLDAIRKASVASGEAGGITQHIGAYHVVTKKGEIVFLDTPGHEAFTAMRARGAQVTDIVVLVVAADDGVKEQTKEAINHSKAAGVPIMVAVNKMDKETADPDRVKRELAEQGLSPEEWGGDTAFSYVSAKSGQGLDEFMELLALQAEVMELKANPEKLARGHIIESRLDKGRGALGTVLIQEGTLHVGDTFVCGVYSGKVRAMFDDQGRKVKEAGPSIPVEVQGFEGVPDAGEAFVSLSDEKMARRIASTRGHKQREKDLAKESRITLETFLARKPTDVETLNLNLVVKADVHGSLEAIAEALQKIGTPKVKVQVIHGAAGAITESDIMLAAASSAIIIGFNVRPTAKIKEVAERENVQIRFYDIIYKLVEEVRDAMEGMLAPVSKEVYLGQAEVRQTFSLPKAGVVAGCFVSDGKISRNAGIRLLRDGVVSHTGKISSLKRFKEDVREVLKGYECGISIENYNDIKVGDIIEAFEVVEEAAKL